MEALTDQAYISLAEQGKSAVDFSKEALTMAGQLYMLADWYNDRSTVLERAMSLITVVVSATIKTGGVPPASSERVFADEPLLRAATLVYDTSDAAWLALGTVARTLLDQFINDIVKGFEQHD